ncbi:MAG: hypothetical protein EPN82_09060 [Bacteroidetes bacterium]|nr:MAG: hypothetical protein EPN82_09060 [Bacteroidota bacterium]
MTTKVLLNEIYTLPVDKRIFLVEKALESIRNEIPKSNSLSDAARELIGEYKKNKELRSFNSLDSVDFYEVG